MGDWTLKMYQEEEKKLFQERDEGYDIAEDLRNLYSGAFNTAADNRYQSRTKKSWEELNSNGYLSYDSCSWADGLYGDEWPDVTEAWECGEIAADQALEEEEDAEREEA